MFLQTDGFGESVNFTINGQDSYPSIFGTLLTLAIATTVTIYSANKFIIMLGREDTTFQETTRQSTDKIDKLLGNDETDIYLILRFTRFGVALRTEEIDGYLRILAVNAKLDQS